ncbi:potassium channel subfamily K member 13-like [Argiope bruennichi]|uniref:potassium channel subfamily K member 13-like n=1 Tax=Argiope bruennichi TaxID=94029 RepID=UPI00249581CB|nr:potassium channel subfamily K member 13-like [Argiope bruennichi]
MTRGKGCCRVLHLHEDNTRFLLLGVVMLIYMAAGAWLFQWLEHQNETDDRKRYWEIYRWFMEKYNGTVDPADVEVLLWEYGNASASGIIQKRPRWDYPGAFYFVGTVVSTIGFGMTTPKTLAGRIVVIFYGFFGCSGAILFFNLFLERIITFLAYILRMLHERDLRKKGFFEGRRDSQQSFDYNLDEWKPSVYWVMLYLFLATIIIATSASFLYSPMEGWTFLDCLYFCFVTFSTIGFGDLVTSQEPHYPHMELYRVANFAFIVCGSCCIYSLFNVTSIVIKQFLNWLMKTLDFSCSCRSRKPPSRPQLLARGRRNAITPYHLRTQARNMGKGADTSDNDSTYDSDGERRNSGEMISMADLLRANKVSLAVMQKELHESAQRGQAIILPSRLAAQENSFKPGAVGPLAIVSKKLGDDDT